MTRLIFFSILLIFPIVTFAAECSDLNSPDKMRSFLRQIKASNPLFRDVLSAHLEISPCDGEECLKKSRKQRISKIQQMHVLRNKDNRRAYIKKGPDAPQCLITRGSRDFLCADCQFTENVACRSVVRSETSSRVIGTNIDVTDFDIFDSTHFISKCEEIPKKPKYLKIVTTRQSGESPYDSVISFFLKEHAVPVTINYFAKNVLRKVYRFFPNYYTNFQGHWIATIMRIRTTRGTEKNYIYETQLRVLQDKSKRHRIYLDPSKDPLLKGKSIQSLFYTE